jgi:hypothetical protein
MFSDIWPYNCILFNFTSKTSLDLACWANPEFSRMIALILPQEGGDIIVLTFGWWNYTEAVGLPEGKPKKTCVFGVAAQLRRIKRRAEQNLLVGAT